MTNRRDGSYNPITKTFLTRHNCFCMGNEYTVWFMICWRRYDGYIPTRTYSNVSLSSFRDSWSSHCCDEDGCFELLADSLSLKLRRRYPFPSVTLYSLSLFPFCALICLSPSLFVLPLILISPFVPPSSRPSVPLYLSVSLRISVSLRVSLRVFVCLSVCPCVSPCLSLSPSVSLDTCLSVRLSLSLCLCVSASLSFLCLCRSFYLSARCTRDRILRQRLSASLFGVWIDGSDSPFTDVEDHTSCVVRTLLLPQTT